MGCRPTGVLRDEHRLILRVVAALEAFVESDPASGSPDNARAFVEFFSLYTDALHHGKEEDHLFDTLVEHGFPRHQGPIAMMLQEHELGRALVRQMAAAIDPTDPGTDRWRALRGPARSYVDLLRRHIQKEDGALFDMADASLDEPACRRLCDAYDAVCAGRFGGRTLEQLEALGEALIDRFG